MDQSRRKRKAGTRSRVPRRNDQIIAHPPTINPQISHLVKRLRFTCTTAAVNKNIGYQNLADTIVIATSAVQAYEMFDALKVHAVEVWAAPAVGTTAQVAVQFVGATPADTGDGRTFSDNSMGIEPAHVLARPSPKSTTALWQAGTAIGTNATAFQLTCPVGAVIDVTLSMRVVSTAGPTAAATALVGATAGEIYYRGLDGLAVAGTTLPAVAPVTG